MTAKRYVVLTASGKIGEIDTWTPRPQPTEHASRQSAEFRAMLLRPPGYAVEVGSRQYEWAMRSFSPAEVLEALNRAMNSQGRTKNLLSRLAGFVGL